VKTSADVLEQAADLIEQGRHLRKMLTDLNGGYCAAGALLKAATGSPYYNYQSTSLPTFDPLVAGAIEAVAGHLELTPTPKSWFRMRGVRFWHSISLTNQLAEAMVMWNNQDGRTGAEVIDAFRHAAKNLRNEKVAA